MCYSVIFPSFLRFIDAESVLAVATNWSLSTSLDGIGYMHRVVRVSLAKSLGPSPVPPTPPPAISAVSAKAQLACETGSWHTGDFIWENSQCSGSTPAKEGSNPLLNSIAVSSAFLGNPDSFLHSHPSYSYKKVLPAAHTCVVKSLPYPFFPIPLLFFLVRACVISNMNSHYSLVTCDAITWVPN